MPIRPMTAAEVTRALRHAADVCEQDERICWFAFDVIPQDGAYQACDAWTELHDGEMYADTPIHAALFLDLVAEAGPPPPDEQAP